MAFSSITLTFSRKVVVDEFINFTITDTDNLPAVNANMVCKDPRSSAGEFDYNGLVGPDYTPDVFTYRGFWQQDYSPLNQYNLIVNGSDVVIEATKNNVTFSGFSSNAGVTAVIVDGDNTPIPEIESITLTKKVGDECNTSVVTVVGSEIITEIGSPIFVAGNGTKTLSFDHPRGQSLILSVEMLGQIVSDLGKIVNLSPNPNASISFVGSQKNLVISAVADGLNFTYSLDNVTYQASNVFEGMPDGTTVFYTKDQYDCVKSSEIFIGDPPRPEPYHFLSNLNPIRYKLDEIWDNVNIFKNTQNTLSCEEDTPLSATYTHKFQKQDNPITQLKTNYQFVNATVIDSNGSKYPLNVNERIVNMGKKDSRDASKIQTESGLWGFYFLSGSTYDYDTGIANGTYELNGELPEWAKKGAYFSLNGVSHQIVSVIVDDSVNAFVIVVNADLSANNSVELIKVKYNLYNYNVYDFKTSMFYLLGREFQIKIELTDNDYDDVTYISERITSLDLLDDLIYFKFFNRDNNSILYKNNNKLIMFGALRLEYDIFGNASEAETDILIGDSDSYINSSNYNGKKEVNFTYLTTAMVEKVQQALALSHLFMRGNSYIAEKIEKPVRIGISNLYNLKATLAEANKNGNDYPLFLEDLYTTSLVDWDDGFVISDVNDNESLWSI